VFGSASLVGAIDVAVPPGTGAGEPDDEEHRKERDPIGVATPVDTASGPMPPRRLNGTDGGDDSLQRLALGAFEADRDHRAVAGRLDHQ